MPSRENVCRREEPPAGLRLIPCDQLDPRTDEEIVSWLLQRHPITSQKNVWAFWDSGFVNMPPWVQRCVINWVRRLGPSWTVHFLDRVSGSDTNVDHFLEPSFFPEAFNAQTMDGPYAGAHQADLIRLPLLWKYGGVWMDAGTYLFRHLDDICWRAIEDPASPYQVGGLHASLPNIADCIVNGFIAARRHDPFIKRWHDVYVALWGSATNAIGFHKHPLISHLPLLPPLPQSVNGVEIPNPVSPEDFTDYLAHFMAFERVRKLVDPSDGFNGPDYLRTNFFLVPAFKECLMLQEVTNFDGVRQHDIFMRLRSGHRAVRDAAWHESEDILSAMLTGAAFMKLCHGGGLLATSLATTWDAKEHWGEDIAKDTFAAYVRYASVHFDQLRKISPLQLEKTTEEILYAGVLEPKEAS